MATERIKGAVAFFCDTGGCGEGIETGEKDFAAAKDHAKAEGWQFRNRDGVWKHYCCRGHEEYDFRGQSIHRSKP